MIRPNLTCHRLQGPKQLTLRIFNAVQEIPIRQSLVSCLQQAFVYILYAPHRLIWQSHAVDQSLKVPWTLPVIQFDLLD